MLKNLKIWQEENGYTTKFVAEKLDMTTDQYNHVKAGRRKPTLAMARKLQEEFKVKNVLELLEDFTDER